MRAAEEARVRAAQLEASAHALEEDDADSLSVASVASALLLIAPQ
ncbi:MAG: hypothetical protein P4L40_13680 [Terracidiphilus sp.]|nr:hypothetical protein [Terracidiphilus sp.]